jgi:Restriction endonuclease
MTHYRADWRERNREKIKEREHARYMRDRDARLSKAKTYQAKNREKYLAYLKQYQRENQPRLKKQRKQYREANAEIIKTRKQAWYQSNAEQRKAAISAWQRAHPTHRRLSACRTRGRQSNAEGTVTVELWLAKCEYHGHRCYLCGKAIKGRLMEMEHRIPLSRGGSNWIANIAPACKQCNGAKGDLTEKEYRHKLAA